MWNPVRHPRLTGLKTPCPLQRISSSQCSPMTLNPVLNLRLSGLKTPSPLQRISRSQCSTRKLKQSESGPQPALYRIADLIENMSIESNPAKISIGTQRRSTTD